MTDTVMTQDPIDTAVNSMRRRVTMVQQTVTIIIRGTSNDTRQVFHHRGKVS